MATPTRYQTLRSSVKGQRPSTGTREVGEIYLNFADRQIGLIDAGKAAQDLVAVRFFSTSSDYAIGDFVIQGGLLYRAKATVTAGAFNATQWDKGATTPAEILAALITVDGAGSGLDADLLDGQSGAYYAVAANYLPLAGGTMTGTLAIAPAASPALMRLNKAASGSYSYIEGQTGALARWQLMLGDNTAEAGANSGSDMKLNRYADNGTTLLGTALSISRATGVVAMSAGATAPTVTAGDNTVNVATTAFVTAAVATAGTTKANLASPVFTGDPQAPTPATADSDTSIATTAFVKAQAYAPLASPVFTGNPTGPTPTAGDNDTSLATTAFVTTALGASASATSVSDTAPGSPKVGQLWFESDSGNTYIWYDDGNTTQWVQVAGPQSAQQTDYVQKIGDNMTGPLAVKTALPANMRGSLVVADEISLSGSAITSANFNFNTFYDTVAAAWKAIAVGFSAVLQLSQTAGLITLYRSPSVAAGATATPAVVASFDVTAGVTFTDAAFSYGGSGANIWHQNKAQTVVTYKMSGGGGFTWYKSSTGLASGTSPTNLMLIDDSGNLTASGYITANGTLSCNNYVQSTTVNLLMGPTGTTGAIYLRPQGIGSTVGQTFVNNDGSLNVAQNVNASGQINFANYLVSSTATALLAATGAGQCYMRPNGFGNAAGQLTVASNGDINAAGNIVCSGSNMAFGAGGTGRIMQFQGGWYWDFATASGDLTWRGSTNTQTLTATGGLILSGSLGQKTGGTVWTNPSDIRIKDVRGPYDHGLAELLQVEPVRYNYKADTDTEYIGIVAQDIEAVMPETVSFTKGEVDGKSVDDLRIFDASAITFALINAVKELSARIEVLEAR